MQPDGVWDGGQQFKFQINRILDSGYAVEPNSCKQCGGLQVFVNKRPPLLIKAKYREVCPSVWQKVS